MEGYGHGESHFDAFPRIGSSSASARHGVGPEAQLAALTQAQAIVHFDLRGTILSANRNFLEVFGYSLSEVQGRHHSMLVPDEEAESDGYREFWAALAAGKHQTATFKRLGKGGREVWIQASYIPVCDEHGAVGVVKYAVDVTTQCMQSASYQGQIEAIERAYGMVEFGLDGVIQYANEQFLRLVGYDYEELVGHHHSILVPAEEKASVSYETFWRQLRAGQFQRGVFVRVAKDGSLRHIQAAYSPILDMEGRPFKVVKYATDVSRQAEIEQELVRAKEQAIAASTSKSMFLATMSHEIRTPMNGVIAASDLLQATALDEEQQELCAIIKSSGESLLALINDILDFSKLEAGKVALHPEPSRPRELLREMERVFSLQMREKGLTFAVTTSELVPQWLVLDSLRLRQILVNLCGNAMKFTNEGQVAVSCDYDTDERLLVLRVRDTGIGITDTQILFQEFSQEDSTRTRKFGGTGLGLAVCKALVELMGGHIAVQSEVNVGSEFVVTLGCCEPQEVPRPVPVLQSIPLPAGCAMVVDDNHVNRAIAIRMLSKLGWSALGCGSGEDALAQLETSQVDLVLMDCQMPHMDGLETTRRIRQLSGPNAQVPVIALTASLLQDEWPKCEAAGMNGFLTKPVRLAELKNALFSFLCAGLAPGSLGEPLPLAVNDV